MDEGLKHEILEHITYLIFNVQPFDKFGRPGTLYVSQEHGVEFCLVGDSFAEYEDLLKLLLEKAGWSERISQKYLDDRLKTMIATILKDTRTQEVKDFGPYLDALVADFDRSFEMQTAYISLLGISMGDNMFPVANFTLRRYTKGLIDELTEKVRRNVSLSDITAEELARKVETYRQSFDSFKNAIVAERKFDYPIEGTRALEIAEEELRRVVDLFRYVIATMYPKRDIENRFLIGLQGEIRRDTRTTFTFSNKEIAQQIQVLRLKEYFPLSTYDNDWLEHIGFFVTSNVLGKPPAELTEYQKTLIRGLRLFSDSQTQFERENEFLGLLNCIENFVSPGAKVRDNVSKTVALLTTTDPDGREQKRIEFQKKYDIRSKITHGSRRTVILDDDLVTVRKAVLLVICWMMHHDQKFSTRKELLRWLNDERLKIWPDACECET